jgi:hypothetical protein
MAIYFVPWEPGPRYFVVAVSITEHRSSKDQAGLSGFPDSSKAQDPGFRWKRRFPPRPVMVFPLIRIQEACANSISLRLPDSPLVAKLARAAYKEHRWKGHPWNHQRIPYQELQRNWRGWQKHRHWEKQNTWGVQGLKSCSESRKVRSSREAKPPSRATVKQRQSRGGKPRPNEAVKLRRPREGRPQSHETAPQSHESSHMENLNEKRQKGRTYSSTLHRRFMHFLAKNITKARKDEDTKENQNSGLSFIPSCVHLATNRSP